ncbi:MAG: hypothetical protein AB1679_12300 [Actinomycetota bacterium]
MVLHPDIARWIVVAEQERLAELVRRSHPRLVIRRRRPRQGG